MLSVYVEEFIGVTDYLIKTGKYKKKKQFLIIEKAALEEYLNKNQYDTAINKLKIWKGLNWIDAEEDRLTKRVHIEGKYRACIKIDLNVFDTLKKVGKNG